jgi:hypothetical protein
MNDDEPRMIEPPGDLRAAVRAIRTPSGSSRASRTPTPGVRRVDRGGETRRDAPPRVEKAVAMLHEGKKER